jgi:hypothetical protein
MLALYSEAKAAVMMMLSVNSWAQVNMEQVKMMVVSL